MQTPEGQKLYHERIGTLFTNVFKVATITHRMDQALAKVRSAGLKSTEIARIDKQAAIMRDRIVLRAKRVAEQLAGIRRSRLSLAWMGSPA
jgi:hypothetical protein